MTEPIRVLIADDHPMFRDGLAAMLRAGPGTELVGEATTGTEAVELARGSQPDVVVMDLRMPGLNGVEATQRIVADSPHVAVLVLTMFDDDDSVFLRPACRSTRVPAQGGRPGTDSPGCLRGSQRRGRFRRPARRADAGLLHCHSRPAAGVPAADRPGTRGPGIGRPRPPNTAIAARLQVSQKTARNHVSNILTKLQVADRAQAIVRARDAGLGHQSRA